MIQQTKDLIKVSLQEIDEYLQITEYYQDGTYHIDMTKVFVLGDILDECLKIKRYEIPNLIIIIK